MERRSFFQVVAGLLAGSTRAPVRPPSPVPGPKAEDLLPDAPPPSHTDPALMFADLRRFVDANPGAVVISADFPDLRRIGFSVFTEPPDGYGSEVSARFDISLLSLKGFSGRESPFFRTSGGRRALAADLMKGNS